MRVILALLLTLALAGCQTAQAPTTPSGKAEVTIRAPLAAIKAQLLSLAMTKRFSVTKDTEYLLQIEKPTENIGAAVLLGSRYDSTPAERVVFTFAPMGDSVRVVAALMFVTNPGSAFERLTPINAGEGVDRTQNTLNELKQTLETPPPTQSPTRSRPPSNQAKLGA